MICIFKIHFFEKIVPKNLPVAYILYVYVRVCEPETKKNRN